MRYYELFDQFEELLNKGWQFFVEGRLVTELEKILRFIQENNVTLVYYPELMIVEIQRLN